MVDVVGRRVALRKAGAGMVGLCPFHKERSPSFSVSPARNTYHCFGCGAHGNALGFLVEHDGLPFRQAVRELAQEVGLALPPELQEGGKAAIDTAPLYAAMDLAQKFFAHCLRETAAAREYLKKDRGLEPRMLKRYLIGYAPQEWRGLKEAFADYERNDAIVAAGLVREKTPEGGGNGRANRYDTFRGRITFGVRDTRGRIVAFGGRSLGGDDGPKYLNSPESPIFDKSGSLFGLFEAREAIRERKEALVVEGYLDVVMLAQHGVENAVASMGTAFTRWHLERLLTQTSRVVFCFDGDAAGQAAAAKALEMCASLIEDEHDFRFVVLPDGLDPDDYVRARGGQALRDLVAQAPGFTQFLISVTQARHGIEHGQAGASAAEARARFAADAAAVARKISYGSRLRSIVLEHIEQESRMPGAALQAMRHKQSTAASVSASLWSRLCACAKAAPLAALEVRDDVLELLDAKDPDERALAAVLSGIDSLAERPDPATPESLMARDTLRAAVDLIFEHRHKQVREELDRQLRAGEISDAQYLQARQELDRANAAPAASENSEEAR